MDDLNTLLKDIESAGLWAYFHKDWLLAIRSALRPQLPVDYHLFVESEAILISPDHAEPASPWLPDITVSRPQSAIRPASDSLSRGTAAVVEAEESYEIETHYSLHIRRAPENHVVAVLEILSPSNKGSGNRFDREKHHRKRQSLLEAGIQLMEIDALLKGACDLPAPLAERLSPFARIAWTAEWREGRRKYRGWGWNEADSLPEVPWRVDDAIEAIVSLPDAMAQAVQFNRWKELADSARRGGGPRR